MIELNRIYNEDCLEGMKRIPDGFIDLTVTSPPYDNLRTYNGYIEQWSFDKFKAIAKELYRVTADGGVVVWVVGDATINGSETGTSFKQALYFKEIGFNLHDTMIYAKRNSIPLTHNRYEQCFEYMFVFSKGKPKTFNPILEETTTKGKKQVKQRNPDGSFRKATGYGKPVKPTKPKHNIWFYKVGGVGQSATDKIAYKHPAIFPEKLAEDHIISWSNEGDIVLDPMAGSGTTLKMAIKNNRNYIGFEISKEYVDIINKRIDEIKSKKESYIFNL